MELIAGDSVDLYKLKACLKQFDGRDYSNAEMHTILDLSKTLTQLSSTSLTRHFHLTFVGSLPLYLYLFLVDKLNVTGIPDHEQRYLVVASGSLTDFYNLFVTHMSNDAEQEQLLLLNYMYRQWRSKYFDRLFPSKDVKQTENGLFYI